MMAAQPHPLTEWFQIVTHALREEDLFLQQSLQPWKAYSTWSPGLYSLFETGLVYVILRATWAASYPNALSWEIAYPNWPNGKLDLAIYDQLRTEEPVLSCPAHAIEVKKKWVGKSEQYAVWSDFFKLLWFTGARARYSLLLTFGYATDDLADDVRVLLAACSESGVDGQSPVAGLVSYVVSSSQDREYCLQKFGSVNEILWSEFDTEFSAKAGPGKVRVSLIEILENQLCEGKNA